MRLTALSYTKIEGDIVEEFVRHTLRFVDQIVVVDNGSLDAAGEILRELQLEGLAVDVWPGSAVPASADIWTPNARRAFAMFESEYLLMLDVDEFLRAPSRPALEAALAGLDGAHGLVPWTTYLPTPDDDAAEPRVLARIQHRLRHESRPFFKVFVHRSFAEHAGALIGPGNHGVVDAQDDVVSRIIPDVQLAHIPVRSLLQLQSKAMLGWPVFLAMGFTEEQGIAYHWRRLNARLLSDTTWDNAEFFRLARQYLDGKESETEVLPELVLDPLPTVERRYARELPALLPLAMRFTGQIARAYAARASDWEAHAATQARFEAEIAASREALRQAEDELSAQSRVGAEALAKSAAEIVRYETHAGELAAVLVSMQRSSSWRLTRPLRLAGILLRDALHRLKRAPAARQG